MIQNTVKLLAENNSFDKPSSLQQGIAEKFEAIFPSIPLMIATIIAFIAISIIIYVFLRKPLQEMLKKRKEFIQSNIDESIKFKEDMIEKLNQANENLENSNKQAEVIINRAKLKAEQIVVTYIAKAKNDSKQLIEEAHLDITKQQKEFEQNSREIVAQTAKQLAEKILQKEISQSTQEEIIEAFLQDDNLKGFE
ncbi:MULTISPECIES: ATP synthase F0 subunit B [unclassified Mycoplasma]|uniref:ATP synthase F0 subunit B n=1 Tax=unclassified Mycoplasma TaxID=2683645 RepID=UPI00211CF5AD|nr:MULTISPECIES: ATP synthase F0 subunit B [unclassified Mycoplasma]UUM20042.1 ATP synthase F0 subunit B [Mycoplasma sp. 1578d]UUM25022.1 ATP synthase F0 subunit B [Mycoplasma sp. 3686d]